MAALAPEIFINTLLQAGFAAVKADTSIVQEVFSTLIEEEQEEIVEFFSKETITTRIGKPPRGPDYKVPLVVIESVGEDEMAEQDLLGDFIGEELDGFQGHVSSGVRLRATYNIIFVGKDNRQARILYRTAVALLILYRYQLEAAGFQNRRMTGNKDVVVDLGADPLEGKMMTLSGEYWFSVKTSERLRNLNFVVGVEATTGQSQINTVVVSVDSQP